MSDIAQTASVTLITAVPGSGKTLRAVWYMREALQKGETVFACNINGLSLDGVIDFPDPTKWEDLPAGSVLVVDECQKFFRAERGGVPSYIAAMETIRHLGIRLILLTQHPALIHANIRALVGHHEHIVRQNGKTTVTIYTRSRVIDNVRSDKGLQLEDHHSWTFPTDCYGLYTSAEIHTFKRTIPHKYKRAAVVSLIGLALLIGVVFLVRHALSKHDPNSDATGSDATGVLAGRVGASSVVMGAMPKIKTATEYAERMQPLLPDAPFTAPAFVNRPMVSEPEVFCMSSGHMAGDVWVVESCSCLTEQGTRYQLEQSKCADLARNGGRYNPFRHPPTSSGGGGDARPVEQSQSAAALPGSSSVQGAAPLGSAIVQGAASQGASSPQQAHYGAMRSGSLN